jgi:2-succinyl-5-enolpyruvyl-6-hydroxy-3-cyclohexene-1-carboxylate synthase
MTSDKKSAALLAEIFVKKGLKHIIISPGSRNAPVILSFASNPNISAFSIVDERSAAFFALGIAQQTNKTVAIACTSGTAALNYAPAIAEAYYQKIPLLVLTADRPEELIDQGDGQTIRQKNLYKNYIKGSFEISEDFNTEKEFNDAVRLINKAINLTIFPDKGPVHINLPFSEPIYNEVESNNWKVKNIRPRINFFDLKEEDIISFAERWNKYGKKLIIAGKMNPNTALSRLINKVADDPSVVVLSETTSNLNNGCSCPCIDRVVSTFLPGEAEAFKPELLVTFGGIVVSKMVKEFIRSNKPIEHWNIDPVDYRMNTYQCLSDGIQAEPFVFCSEMNKQNVPQKSNYKELWQERNSRSELRHKEFLKDCDYSDLKVFETILNAIPENSQLQLGNSTPVRYAQLFKTGKNLVSYSNRGTSGIDGTVSTAAGACHASNQLTTLIVGDLGFFYDSNALMNNYLSPRLRIIIINNSGGGIFRFIPGPDKTLHLQEFFETKHNWSAEHIAINFNVHYDSARNLSELTFLLQHFYDPIFFDNPAILEIFTPNEKNAEILRSYFKYLRD